MTVADINSKRDVLHPTKRKRQMPLDPAHQLLAGRPASSVEEKVWGDLIHLPTEIARRYGADRFDLLISVRVIVQCFEKLARIQRWQPGFFLVSITENGDRYLDVKFPGTSILEFFTTSTRDRVLSIGINFASCDIHPYFSLLCEVFQQGTKFEIEGWQYKVEDIADRYSLDQSRFKFLNHPHVYYICDHLNNFFAALYQITRNTREKAKSFRRTPTENRRRLMQYACHLLDGEPQTMVAHLTIRRDTKVIGSDPPIPRSRSEELRAKLTKHIKREIPRSDYLGHAILLKHDAILGCWLEAFVFFTSNALIGDSDLMTKLVGRWNGEIGPSRAGCVGEMLFRTHFGADTRYRSTLERIVLVCEPDFYSRVSADGLHRFWCTQSPIGKLTQRTRQSKRREAQKKRAANAERSPISRLHEIAIADDDELLQGVRWTQKRAQHANKISTRNRKAAQKRSPQKGSSDASAPGHAPTYMTAISYVSVVAANDALHDLRDHDAGAPVTSQENASATNLPPCPSIENNGTASSTDSTPTISAAHRHEIRLERRKRDIKESDENRERIEVEVRKKRNFVRKPED
ncbi:hypothetical protein [Trinickia dinghuensis]|uniref:hypothetical protein n=1 Tax=Trinickia dinghuensis TaxID=2291023 RepID=UPI0011C039F3|nr:hypothetical protein [Trinickia dinghuensis]